MPFRILNSFSGKVIDTKTKEPITGAAVLAVYHKETYSIAGSDTLEIDAQETLTDENGEFKIPLRLRWFRLFRGLSRGNLIVFKPGYGVFPDHKLSNAVGENKSWPPSGKYIVYELPRLETREERQKNTHFDHLNEIPYQKRELLIKLLNEEYIYLGLPLISVDK